MIRVRCVLRGPSYHMTIQQKGVRMFFSVHISAESCTLNLLYVISKLQCKIDQVS